ncbi:hypothetical protein ACFQ6Q_04560 [Streptomyces sp. NPDC056437]|uniref:hypothetical protein n=1 Tax=Streptomyces sp. NPDC056437 TaxID=3345816 RepID=UPI0036794826
MTAPTTDAARSLRCKDAAVPPAAELGWEAYMGRACYACGRQLTRNAVHKGWARGRAGVHVLDTEVWACPA